MPNFRLRTLASTRMRRVAALAMLRRNVVLLGLPPRVAIFYSRARRAAARSGDRWSLESATGPRSLALLLRAARGRRRVVEIGTGTAWTTAALALADHKRRVLSFDPTVWPERDRYLRLAGPEAATRIQLVTGGGEDGPGEFGWRPDMLFVDGSHDRDLTVRTFENWRPAFAPGAVVAFHDYQNPAYPGVSEAIAALGLEGKARGDLFFWQAA
ncbi:MAG: class I SAM-dependent methyltransferase [Actinobacteria bacterium]|nr:MAG: class I SAM-dependent methyltransferase [Actinomycetota bacterium]